MTLFTYLQLKSLRLIAICLLATSFFYSCEKNSDLNELELTSSENLSIEDFHPMLKQVEEFDVSESFDAMTFHTGVALQSLLSSGEFEAVRNSITLNDANLSLGELLSTNNELRSKLNARIRESMTQNSIYDGWKNKEIESALQQFDSDLLSVFNDLIASQNSDNEMVLYVPEDLVAEKDKSNVLLGLDISLPDENLALVFDNQKPLLLSIEEAMAVNDQVVFVGINKATESSTVNFRKNATPKLQKWYHYGKVERQACTNLCDIDYEWHTKYRWYSGWRFKEGGTLTTEGQITQYYYWGYRIKVQVLWLGLSNFDIYEKHWIDSPWELVEI